MLYEWREAVIKLFNDYSSKGSEAKDKAVHGKGTPSMLAHVAKVSNLKILSPEQILQRLPIAFAQVKTGDTFENLWNEIRRIIYFLFRVVYKLLRKYTI